jgi:hypothetical protein
MHLPVTNALKKFLERRPVVAWLVYNLFVFFGLLLVSIGKDASSAFVLSDIGEVAIASSILTSVFCICIWLLPLD